jgi:hypothetical protein
MRKTTDIPYPGARAYQEADHDRFGGRAAAAATVVDLWSANRLTVVSGSVASGKTSLIRAGAYPEMRDKQADVFPVGLLSHGMTFPFAAIPGYNPYTLSLLRSWSPAEVPTRLAGVTVSEHLRDVTRGQAERVIFAVIDQLDDLVLDVGSGTRRVWRREFLTEIAQACEDHPRLHLLAVGRTEAADLIMSLLGGGATYQVQPLSPQEAIEAAVRPASKAGRELTEAAAELLIDDLRTSRVGRPASVRHIVASHVEPRLLQAACLQLWRNLPAGLPVVTDWAVREFSDVDSALAHYCGRALGRVAAEHDLTHRHLHSWLVETFITDGGTRGLVPEGPITTAGMPNTVPRALVDQHVLSVELRSSLRWYQLLADRLVEPLRLTAEDRPGPLSADDYLRAAERDLAQGETGLAQRHAERVVQARPSMRMEADAESLLGNVAYEEEKAAEAAPHYREAASLLEAAGDTSGAARQLAAVGQALLAQGLASEATSQLQASVDRAPSDPVFQTQLAQALWHSGQGRAAVAVLGGVLGIDGANREALRLRGEILADLGDARDAILDLERQSIPDLPSTRAARGLALAKLGNHSAATKEIDEAVARAPRNGPVLLYAARASALTGDKVSTGELAKRAIDATDPPLSRSHLQVALKLSGR